MDKKGKFIFKGTTFILPLALFYLLNNLGIEFLSGVSTLNNLFGMTIYVLAFIGLMFFLFGVIDLVSKKGKKRFVKPTIGLLFMLTGLVVIKYGYNYCTSEKLLNCKDSYEFYMFILEIIGIIILINWFSSKKNV